MTSPKEIIAKMKTPRKNFYNVISKLENVGFLRMGVGNTIQPTLLGNVVFNVIATLDIATNVYTKIKTIDAVEGGNWISDEGGNGQIN